MTIPEIKAGVPLVAVLSHYGLEAGPTGAMRCPFHDDKAASMKVYHDTNTALLVRRWLRRVRVST